MLSQKLVLKLFRKGLPKYGHLPKASLTPEKKVNSRQLSSLIDQRTRSRELLMDPPKELHQSLLCLRQIRKTSVFLQR
ncbi:hypothetical protein RB195_003614 [Necator americanus]|uniref:Uncharacterized protein n=1 Tax=Necator americanus TaxID=51031 RepID=A0ABR1DQ57_NECAM